MYGWVHYGDTFHVEVNQGQGLVPIYNQEEYKQALQLPSGGGFAYRQRNEEKDEEYAARLQTEECGSHHERIMAHKEFSMSCPGIVSLSTEASPNSTMMVACSQQCEETLESFGGKVVLRGTQSQYNVQGGESACTSICLVAARHLLLVDSNPMESFDSSIMDMVVHFGVQKHGMAQVASGHSCVDDLWALPAFSDHAASLQRKAPITAAVGFDGFYKALDESWTYATEHDCPRVAVVLTKSPETVLCFACQHDQWYLFDSHGESNAPQKVAYLMRFESTTAMALALQHKFPLLPGADNLQAQMYNFFEATALVANNEKPSADNYGPTDITGEARSVADSKSETRQVPLSHGNVLEGMSTLQQVSARQIEQCFDSVTTILMADPVLCDDGSTYDRTSIERHFQSRRDAEEARQRGTDEEETNGNSTCCGGRRRQIELTSPNTREVVSDRLVPNRFVEQLIVDLVEANLLDLSDEDLADWRARREEKREKDRQRNEEVRQFREEQEEMRRNREEAQQRRASEATSDEDYVLISSGEPPSQLVRLDRRRDHESSSGHLGIAVSLCDKSSWMPREYALNICQEGVLRCMVACCAGRLDMDELLWCSRCGRIACSSCLGFQVTNYNEIQSSESHRICAECLMQIVDVMPRDGAKGQARAVLVRMRLQPYLNVLSQRAVAAQDVVLRRAADEEFGPGIRELQNDVEGLLDERNNLQTQIREAEQRAEQARADDGASAVSGSGGTRESVNEWEEVCADLSSQFEALIQKNVQDADEDVQFGHMQAVSEIRHRLEEAQMSLAQARSSSAIAVEDTDAATGSVDTETSPLETSDSMTVAGLQDICDSLDRQFQQLLSEDIPDDEVRLLAHVTALSDIECRLEQAQIKLAQARSTQHASDATIRRQNGDLAAQIRDFAEQVRVIRPQGNPAVTRKRGIFGGRKARPVSRDKCGGLHGQLDDIVRQAGNYSSGHILESRRLVLDELQRGLENIWTKIQPVTSNLIQTSYKSILQELNVEKQDIRDSAVEQSELKQAARNLQVKSVSSMSLDELQKEFLALTAKVDTLCDVNEITLTMMRVSEIQQRLEEAEESFLTGENQVDAPTESDQADHESWHECHGGDDNESSPGSSDSGNSDLSDESTSNGGDGSNDHDPDLLNAIGKVMDEEWPLPLGLTYPTARMSNELELLQNALEQNLPKSQQKYDDEYHNQRLKLTGKKDQLEDEVANLRTKAHNAEASADNEQERLETRRERRRQEEAERKERERERLERERKAREAEAALRQKHADDENATREALARAVGREDNAEAFGGRGDFRMCKVCKAGPIENIACSDLEAHNDNSNQYKGSTVVRTTNPNHCRHCGFYDSNWHNWPKWDGIFGPH